MIRRNVLVVLAAATAALPQVAAAVPVVSARAYIVVNADTGEVLAERNADTRTAMASTTKMMTAMVTMKRITLTRVVTVPRNAVTIEGSSAGLVAGERITVRHLLTGLLVGSGNDASLVLARTVGGGVPNFVQLMNAEASDMGLRDTRFANPHGLDAPGHFSTPRELVKMGKTLREDYPFLRDVVRNRRVAIPGPNGNGVRRLESENELLSIDPRADGIKTGQTDDAGYALVAHATDPTRKINLYLATIGAPSSRQRALDAKALFDWGFRQYARTTVIAPGQTVLSLPVRDRPGTTAQVVTNAPLALTVRLGAGLTQRVVVQPELVTPARRGQVVGSLTVMSGDRALAVRKLVLANDVDEPNAVERIRAGIGRLL